MAYYTKVLQPGEQIVYNRRLHWIIYVLPILFIPFWGIGLIFLFLAWATRITTEIVVTNKRVLLKKGWISRQTREMNIDKIETVDVDQSIMGRMLNYGTVYVRGTGSTYEPLRNVDRPIELRNAIKVK